ncbi:MAG: mechanosensitive ion channel family protein [Candidatus Nanopelagicales bacterium]|nr:mechanosensitive ion channel family protein [Candidatus Nanopelagicales bacterium]
MIAHPAADPAAALGHALAEPAAALVQPLADAAPENWWDGFWGIGLTVGLIIVVAALLHLLVARIINRAVKRWIASGHSRADSLVDNPEETVELQAMIMSQRREQRARAVGQLLRSAFALLIWGTAVLLALTELGVNIAPLIASAGVLGVALGFGAQTLVKDYLSGFFLIVEDQYGVGDLVDVGPVIGNVEEVTLRITRIRDMTGVVWYVRNGEILRVANQSQGWTMASAVIPVAYDANLEQLRRIVTEVGTEMANDPETSRMMLGRPTFAGVDAVSGEAVYVRIVAKARASQQVPLTRELRERLKVAFDRNGVVVPVLVRPVQFGPDGTPLPPGSPPPAAPAR